MIATAIYERRFEDARRLIEKGTHDIHEREGTNDWTPIFGACHRGHVGLVRLLLDKAADANDGVLVDLMPPLYIAILNGHTRICLLLIKHGADFTIGIGPNKPIRTACRRYRLSTVCVLLEYGAEPIDDPMCSEALEILSNKTQLRHLLPRELVAIAYAFLV